MVRWKRGAIRRHGRRGRTCRTLNHASDERSCDEEMQSLTSMKKNADILHNIQHERHQPSNLRTLQICSTTQRIRSTLFEDMVEMPIKTRVNAL